MEWRGQGRWGRGGVEWGWRGGTEEELGGQGGWDRGGVEWGGGVGERRS